MSLFLFSRVFIFPLQPPGWAFGTAERSGSDKPKYDFYENAAFLDDPLSADAARKERCKAPKIGTEPRVIINAFFILLQQM